MRLSGLWLGYLDHNLDCDLVCLILDDSAHFPQHFCKTNKCHVNLILRGPTTIIAMPYVDDPSKYWIMIVANQQLTFNPKPTSQPQNHVMVRVNSQQ